MIIDASELQQDSRIDADVIIAGGGMAGITLARGLGDAGFAVAILESGGLTPNVRNQALYAGKMTLGAPGNDARKLDDYNAVELESFGRSLRLLAAELGRLDVGRVRWMDVGQQLVQFMGTPSRHHMGATRMSRSPAGGVVDEHARVHGIENLYVAGSSVFPTSGIANPTLTLLALAHRLADRVSLRLKS